MANQLSMIPGEDDLQKLCDERAEARGQIKPLLELVKGNADFLKKYSPFTSDVFFKHEHLEAAIENTVIAEKQGRELSEALVKLTGLFRTYDFLTGEIDRLKAEINAATDGVFQVERPELFGTSPEQLEAEADAILETSGVKAETALPEPEPEDAESYSYEDPAQAI